MWFIVLGVVTLAGLAWLFVAVITVGLAEGRATRRAKRNVYLALGLVLIAGLGLALVAYS